MKKLYCLVTIFIFVFMLFTTVYAEQNNMNKITFSEFLGENFESVKNVELYYQYDGTDIDYDIDIETFKELSDKIVLTDIEDNPLFTEGDRLYNLLYINCYDNNGKLVTFAAINGYGETDKYNLMFSRLPIADYKMDLDDLIKLYYLIPEDESSLNLVLTVSSDNHLEKIDLNRLDNKNQFINNKKEFDWEKVYFIVERFTLLFLLIMILLSVREMNKVSKEERRKNKE